MNESSVENLSEEEILYLYNDIVTNNLDYTAKWCACCKSSYCSANWLTSQYWDKFITGEDAHTTPLGRNGTDRNGCWLYCYWNYNHCDINAPFGYDCTSYNRYRALGCEEACKADGFYTGTGYN